METIQIVYFERAAASLLLFGLVVLLVVCQGVGPTANRITGAQPGQLSVNPSTLNVGSVSVRSSGTASGSLTAAVSIVTISAATSSNPAFMISGLSLPATIPVGANVPFTVTFSPTTEGAETATLTFTSNATVSPIMEALTGTGTPTPVHSVNLSWNGGTSRNISGYNIYRAAYSPAPVNACGSFAKINPLLNAGTTYTDSNVTDGTAYCYAATAVNTSHAESGYSNIVSDVQIPPP
jgi:Abnormal spindle-like microcephaly-assoc'd, ASPM-SPD-2-Hydin